MALHGAGKCALCLEQCAVVDDPSLELRLVRYRCVRKAASNGRGRGGGNGARAVGCDWRVCFFCANAFDDSAPVRCGVCGLAAQERSDSSEDEEGEHDEDEDEDAEDDEEGDNEEGDSEEDEEDSSGWPTLTNQRGRGRGHSRACAPRTPCASPCQSAAQCWWFHHRRCGGCRRPA